MRDRYRLALRNRSHSVRQHSCHLARSAPFPCSSASLFLKVAYECQGIELVGVGNHREALFAVRRDGYVYWKEKRIEEVRRESEAELSDQSQPSQALAYLGG